eukprot:CAMPEP_0167768840 /NCGR_PEP_ID=MMETSP0110_2-20121227/16915_1 /TAXON_ID=629695 /ORGANISM="Gymnochlora sp., Strain CCMP2014" /LENGTH=268 /DNA_ID=CAMNT_0007657607 /DNA_START=19 /DNA_END=825 /DNA_ORIENTATION=-
MIVDGEFIQQALRYKVHIKEQIPKLFSSPVMPCVTRCTVSALRKKGDSHSGASLIAKRFTRVPCIHEGIIDERECISGLAGKSNDQHYCYAAQDVKLRNTIRKVPAAPLSFLREAVPILETPSQASKVKAKEAMDEKRGLSTFEEKNLTELREENKTEKKRRKRKGPKGPNPLSCKKKRRKPQPAPKKKNPSRRSEEESKDKPKLNQEDWERRKRRRRRGKKKKIGVNGETDLKNGVKPDEIRHNDDSSTKNNPQTEKAAEMSILEGW